MAHGIISLYKKIPRQVITGAFLVAVIIFLVIYLKGTDFSRLEHLKINWWLIAASLVWALFFRYWMVIIWRAILRALGTATLPPFSVMSHIYAKAWISRYIPGTVTWIAGKIYMAAGYGISKSRLAVSSLLEGGMQVAASTIVSLFILGFSPHILKIPLVARVLVVLVSIVCLFILFPPIFNRMLHLAHTLLRKEAPHHELRINGKAVTVSFVLFAIGTFINGIASFLVVWAIVPTTTISWLLYLIGAFGLAGAIGIATPFLPSGIGVRDGAILILLTAIMPKELALTVTVVTRLWQLLGDVIFVGMTGLLIRYFKLTIPGSQPTK